MIYIYEKDGDTKKKTYNDDDEEQDQKQQQKRSKWSSNPTSFSKSLKSLDDLDRGSRFSSVLIENDDDDDDEECCLDWWSWKPE